MSEPAHTFEGRCHCGAIAVTLVLSRDAGDFGLRTCACDFCRRHGTRMLSDPRGHAGFVLDEANVTRYRFGTGTADFLICRRCGVFAGAIDSEGPKPVCVINTRGIGIEAFAGNACDVHDFDGETGAARAGRRQLNWTPCDVQRRPDQSTKEAS